MIRELPAGDTALAAAALLELRPHLGSEDAVVAAADAQRAGGYRVTGSFEQGAGDAAAAAGFRIIDRLAYGRILYVDDLVCRAERRRRGHAGALMVWLREEALNAGCAAWHLDSGVQAERADAHRLYFNSGMRITSYHFAAPLR